MTRPSREVRATASTDARRSVTAWTRPLLVGRRLWCSPCPAQVSTTQFPRVVRCTPGSIGSWGTERRPRAPQAPFIARRALTPSGQTTPHRLCISWRCGTRAALEDAFIESAIIPCQLWPLASRLLKVRSTGRCCLWTPFLGVQTWLTPRLCSRHFRLVVCSRSSLSPVLDCVGAFAKYRTHRHHRRVRARARGPRRNLRVHRGGSSGIILTPVRWRVAVWSVSARCRRPSTCARRAGPWAS